MQGGRGNAGSGHSAGAGGGSCRSCSRRLPGGAARREALAPCPTVATCEHSSKRPRRGWFALRDPCERREHRGGVGELGGAPVGMHVDHDRLLVPSFGGRCVGKSNSHSGTVLGFFLPASTWCRSRAILRTGAREPT